MAFPPVTPAQWMAQVEKELAGKSFEKTLVHEGILPLYTAAPQTLRDPTAGPFRICMRGSVEDLEEGADALWVTGEIPAVKGAFLVVDGDAIPTEGRFAFGLDPLARGDFDLSSLGPTARKVGDRGTAVTVSTLPYHEAGCDAVDELACALSTGVSYLEALLEAGLTIDEAARTISVRICVGRDTFLELCKLRALRTVWRKLLAGAGLTSAPHTLVHAVCSTRTLSQRDPWVNMLRVTTQVFSAVLGGADLVTPNAFDQALGEPSAHGQRVARNTGLVLREESLLGKVADPAGGAYAFETMTDGLARKAWARFVEVEKDGGMAAALKSGALAARFEAAWKERLAQIARRKVAVLGVSEFANLDEVLPASGARSPVSGHRDSEAFEALRDRAVNAPEALLVTLGSLAESRPRAGFATSFFAAGGIRSRESEVDAKAAIACLCGTDERYAAEAVARVKALKAAGCAKVLIAGRPGALEKPLLDAGADGFIFVGCDAVATLSELLS